MLRCFDAVHFYDEFALDRQLVDSGEVRHVIPGHDSRLMTQFTPATGRLTGLAVTIGGSPAAEL